VTKTSEILIERAINGEDPGSILDDVVCGSLDLFRAANTSEGTPSDEADMAEVNTYFDAYGELRFAKDGVQINELTPMMVELQQVADVASADSGLVELMDGYEGTIEDLHSAVLSRYHLVRPRD